MLLKKVFSKQNIQISILTIIVTISVIVYIFTVGARLTKAREIYLDAYGEAAEIGVENLSEEEKNSIADKAQQSLDLWYDPEVDAFLRDLRE
jgi:hypothetical protein